MTYQGDVRHAFEDGDRKGPNLLGEWMYVDVVEYDAERNVTRVGFRYTPESVHESE